MKRSRVLLSAALALIASCDDSTGPDGLVAAGTVSFNFTGGGGGSYEVTGAPPLNSGSLLSTSWSAGERDDNLSVLTVTSVRAQGGGEFDIVLIQIPRLTPGSTTIETCTAAQCPEFGFTIGTTEDDPFEWQYSCLLETGTISIVTVTSTRATGTFSGTGTCTDASFNDTAFIVNGGTFDVAVVSDIAP